ncbi:MAG: hypothetical protein H8E51_05065, partial [Bacteroidetes bacterium]|nr:hypothetical protein [Bacteroidota bacterium]
MKKVFSFLFVVMIATFSFSQINITITNPEAVDVILGNYNPATYTPGVIINHP